jgi:hypothetical protein
MCSVSDAGGVWKDQCQLQVYTVMVSLVVAEPSIASVHQTTTIAFTIRRQSLVSPLCHRERLPTHGFPAGSVLHPVLKRVRRTRASGLGYW